MDILEKLKNNEWEKEVNSICDNEFNIKIKLLKKNQTVIAGGIHSANSFGVHALKHGFLFVDLISLKEREKSHCLT